MKIIFFTLLLFIPSFLIAQTDTTTKRESSTVMFGDGKSVSNPGKYNSQAVKLGILSPLIGRYGLFF
jgi:hypothetical protein